MMLHRCKLFSIRSASLWRKINEPFRLGNALNLTDEFFYMTILTRINMVDQMIIFCFDKSCSNTGKTLNWNRICSSILSQLIKNSKFEPQQTGSNFADVSVIFFGDSRKTCSKLEQDY